MTIALVEPSLQTIVPELIETNAAVAAEVRRGLSSNPKTLSPWLFYDEAGSRLFEEITALPEYYLTRTERELFRAHAEEIFVELGEGVAGGLTIAELGAGTAAKTGILLEALTRFQEGVLYQPIDISPTALEEAREAIERSLPEVMVRPRLANYITEPFSIEREVGRGVLALYIGSSIGNFSPEEARGILGKLREQLEPGDALLLGTDLAPSATKSVARLLAAYDDAAGVTAAFNRNVLVRLNRELDADFDLKRFVHRARWNAVESRIEMHLESTRAQTVRIPANCAGEALAIRFARGETIHTENSCKFTAEGIARLLGDSGFATGRTFVDPEGLFAVTLARSV